MASIYKTDVKEIKKIMIDRGINTMTELSEKSGINRNTLSQVLNGESQPSSDVMDKLVSALKIEPEKAGHIFFSLNLRNR